MMRSFVGGGRKLGAKEAGIFRSRSETNCEHVVGKEGGME